MADLEQCLQAWDEDSTACRQHCSAERGDCYNRCVVAYDADKAFCLQSYNDCLSASNGDPQCIEACETDYDACPAYAGQAADLCYSDRGDHVGRCADDSSALYDEWGGP